MENKESQSYLSFSDMWEIFVSHAWQIIIIALLVFGVLATYGAVTYSPEYESTSTIYILPKSDDKALSTSDLSIAINTVNDCTEILTSNRVFELVKEEIGLVDTINYETFKSMITITNKEDSRVLYVTVTAPQPQEAKLVVDALCEIGANEIVDIMGVDQVNLVDYGTLEKTPSNSRFSKLAVLAGMAVAIITYCFFLIIYILDDKINIPDDVEKYLGVSILGVIPDSNDAASGKRYGRYGNNTSSRQKIGKWRC